MCAVAVSYRSFSLTSALSAIIIVVNNAAAVTDLIIGCQCVPLEALCSTFDR